MKWEQDEHFPFVGFSHLFKGPSLHKWEVFSVFACSFSYLVANGVVCGVQRGGGGVLPKLDPWVTKGSPEKIYRKLV